MNIQLCVGLFLSAESEFGINLVSLWLSVNASPEDLIIPMH